MSRVDVATGYVLFWGALIGIVLMAAGVVVYGAGGHAWDSLDLQRVLENRQTGHPPDVFVSGTQILRGLERWPADPVAVVALGIVVLLLTPVASVVVAALAFARAGDRRFTAVSFVVLAVLVLGFVLGVG